MNQLIIFLVGAVVGGVVVFYAVKRPQGSLKAHKPGLLERQQQEKADNLRRVLELFAEREKVTNDDVEHTLGVSNATAERYLDELEKKGTITQHGTTGAGVFYTKK